MENIVEQVVSRDELERYNKGENNTEVQRIWEKMINSFSRTSREEAMKKGFTLKKIDELMGLTNFIIEVENPSEELQGELNKQNLFIICIND